MSWLRRFLRDDLGITTVEWVVITAVVMLGALGISSMVLTGADDLGSSVASKMSATAASIDEDDGGNNRGGNGNGNGRNRGNFGNRHR